MKVGVKTNHVVRLMHPRHVVLVTCIDQKSGKPNIVTLAWSMPLSIDPPMVAISISPKRYSHGLIIENKEFVVNIPTINLVKQTLFCGKTSGRELDKFKETGLTPKPSKKVMPPIIEECIAHLECRVTNSITTGDHTLFISDVLDAYVNEDVFTREIVDTSIAPIINHFGAEYFAAASKDIREIKL